MIAKLTTGNGFKGAINYDTRKGKEASLVSVIAFRGVSCAEDSRGRLCVNLKLAAFDFRQQTMTYSGTIRKPVYHWALSYSPEDHVSVEQMHEDAKDFLKRIGFNETQYIITEHRDKRHHHLHIITNVINDKAERINTENLIDRAHKAAAAITKKRGYTWGEKRTAETVETAHKPHERVRHIIEPIIRAAVGKATSFDELTELLRQQKISCVIKNAADGVRGGISFAYTYEGQEHTFRGSSVNRQLSFGYILKAVQSNAAKQHKSEEENITMCQCALMAILDSRCTEDLQEFRKKTGITIRPEYTPRLSDFTIIYSGGQKDKASNHLSESNISSIRNMWTRHAKAIIEMPVQSQQNEHKEQPSFVDNRGIGHTQRCNTTYNDEDELKPRKKKGIKL